MTTQEYDPATCITVAELRALGTVVASGIPDCAWVPRTAMHIGVGTGNHIAEDMQQGILRMNFNVSFNEPFRWVSIDITVAP